MLIYLHRSRYPFQFYSSRSFYRLCTTYQKIPYFIAAYGYKLISKIIMENIPEVKSIKKPRIDSRWDDPDLQQGIDHQSIGMLQHFIQKNNSILLTYYSYYVRMFLDKKTERIFHYDS